jgi:hypothetical protein
MPRCAATAPALRAVGEAHDVACYLYETEAAVGAAPR